MTLINGIKENDKMIEERINKEIDSFGMAYKIKDQVVDSHCIRGKVGKHIFLI